MRPVTIYDSEVEVHGEPSPGIPSGDPLSERGDIGMGYWQARAVLAETLPLHPRLVDYSPLKLRDALEVCADAFAAFVLHQHAAVVQQRDEAYRAIREDHAKRANRDGKCCCVFCEDFRATRPPTPGDTP